MDERAVPRAAGGVIEVTAVNRVRVVCETIPFFRSVSFGVWIFAGSRDETEATSGAFHFLEHLVFKGTATRDAAAIAVEIDELGGHIDAFTSREVTCYSGHVVTERLDRAFDLVADIMLNADFPDEEIERERQVVLEEILSVEDSPGDYIHDRVYPARWAGHPLGRPITGTPETVRTITRDDLIRLRETFYRPPHIIVTACGAVELGRLTDLVERYFGRIEPNRCERTLDEPKNRTGLEVIHKPVEQTHLILATKGLPARHPKRRELSILNMIFGGGVSSRLFQTVRERRGLSYSIYSFFDQYLETGLFGIYAACSASAIERLWEAVQDEIGEIVRHTPSEKEIERAKTQSADNLKMSFESLGARLSQLAYQTLYHGRVFTLEEMLDEVNAVTATGVRELAEELFAEKDYTILALGPVTEAQVGFMAG